MTKASPHIARIISIQFDINTDISYQTFCKNKDYQSKVKIVDDCFILEDWLHYLSNFFPVWLVFDIVRSLNIDWYSIVDILGKMLRYDMMETFSGSKDIITRINYLIKSKFTDMDFLDFIQACAVSYNGLAYSPYTNDYDYKQLLNEEHLNNEMYSNLMGSIIEGVTYSQENIYHKRLEYIIFQILIQKTDIFLLYAHPHDVIICSENNLSKHLTCTYIVHNLSKFLYEHLPKDVQDHLSALKWQYMKDDLLDVYFKQIREQFADTKNIELSVVSKEKFSLDRWKEFEQNYPSSSISETNHKSVKKTITLERTFKLKK